MNFKLFFKNFSIFQFFFFIVYDKENKVDAIKAKKDFIKNNFKYYFIMLYMVYILIILF